MIEQKGPYVITLDMICDGCGHCKRDGEYEKEDPYCEKLQKAFRDVVKMDDGKK